nr:monocarboxylate transporter 9-like [Lytechinus pictus]
MDYIFQTCRSVRNRIYWGWIVSVTASITFGLSFGFLYSFGIIMVDLMSQFDSSATATGYIGTLAYGMGSVWSLATVPLSVKFGYRPASMVGLIFCVGGCIVTSFAPGLPLMYFSHSVLYGFGASILQTGSINITQGYFIGRRNSSLAVAIASSGANLGALIMTPLVYMLSDRFGWRIMFRVISGVLLIFLIPAILTFKPVPLQKMAEKLEVEELDEKPPAIRKNASDQDQDAGTSDRKIFQRTIHEERISGSTPACRSTTPYDKDMTVLNSNMESIGSHRTCLDGNSFRNNLKDDQQFKSLVPERIEDGLYLEKNIGTDVSLNQNSIRDSDVCSHLNDANPQCVEPCLQEYDLMTPKDDQSKEVPVPRVNTYWGRVTTLLRMPDVWLLEFGMMAESVSVSFALFSTANVAVTAGISKKTASLVVAFMGLSEFFGKIFVGLIADRFPIPKIIILMIANSVQSLLMLILSLITVTEPYLFVHATVQGFIVLAAIDSLCHSVAHQLFAPEFAVQIWSVTMVFMGVGGIFGAMFGESVDRTGTYQTAFYSTIGMSFLSTFCLILCIVHQRLFARDRFFLFKKHSRPLRYEEIKQSDEKDTDCRKNINDCKGEVLNYSSNLVVTEIVSCV